MASPMEVLRLVAGSLYVLIAPGLAWSFVFFPKVRPLDAPKGEPGLDWIERVAVAFGLSIALVPSAMLLLGYFLKLPMTTLSVVLVVAALSLVPLGLVYRRRRMGGAAPPERPEPGSGV